MQFGCSKILCICYLPFCIHKSETTSYLNHAQSQNDASSVLFLPKVYLFQVSGLFASCRRGPIILCDIYASGNIESMMYKIHQQNYVLHRRACKQHDLFLMLILHREHVTYLYPLWINNPHGWRSILTWPQHSSHIQFIYHAQKGAM